MLFVLSKNTFNTIGERRDGAAEDPLRFVSLSNSDQAKTYKKSKLFQKVIKKNPARDSRKRKEKPSLILYCQLKRAAETEGFLLVGELLSMCV